MDVRQLANQIIRPTLAYVGDGLPGFASEAAVRLLLGTAAVESELHYLAQVPTGPAQGIYQIEPATAEDIHNSFLRYRLPLRSRVMELAAAHPVEAQQLASNLAYATAIARLVYWRSPLKLPAADDIEGMAGMWKQVFNTSLGAGEPAKFIEAYRRLIQPKL
ncbi:hypothetical protein [Oceanibaculum indicum]|uniref:Uncharacterized protein n=1 Tax=Oceanibaculum indicum P24 TaxID=1207063 RepID=K2JV57_9PROT|nr:hypothetical protein [Oceanibaculum indicum]EKE78447.1 hypothetical protein P24_02766 [Oceanibaculum indicum P24]